MITRTMLIVLCQLAQYCRSGTGCPSHATLAERADCSERTVERTLARASDLKILTWKQGRRRFVHGRWQRQSNRYQLLRQTRQFVGSKILEKKAKKDSGSTRKERSAMEFAGERTVAQQLAQLGVAVAPSAGSPDFKRAVDVALLGRTPIAAGECHSIEEQLRVLGVKPGAGDLLAARRKEINARLASGWRAEPPPPPSDLLSERRHELAARMACGWRPGKAWNEPPDAVSLTDQRPR